MEPSFWVGFALSVGLGGLIGLEREHHADTRKEVIAGVRTFPLVSLSGYMMAVVAITAGEPLILAAGVLFITLLAIAFLFVRHRLGVTGLTSPVALVVTFLLGLLVAYNYVQEALVIGVATTFLLLTKERLHGFAFGLDDEEMLGALQFIAVAFIALPLASNLPPEIDAVPFVGRGQVVDPYRILIIAVLVSAVSFAGFLAMRALGNRRGTEVMGLLGGLVNSEATTASLATTVRDHPALSGAAATAVLLAVGTMLVRILVIAGLADPTFGVLFAMAPAIIAMMAIAVLFAYLRWRTSEEEAPDGPIRLKNPFAVAPALRFAALFALLAGLSEAIALRYGEAGVYVTALSGLFTAGANVASLATLYATGKISLEIAATTAIATSVFGVLNKFVVLRTMSEDLLKRTGTALAVVTITGVGALLVLVVAGAF